jgi:hypothetical protein
MSKPNLREEMPVVTELIDRFRKTFGRANIDDVIRRGMKGEPVFYASENGHTIGTDWPDVKPPEPLAVDLATETPRERHDREAKERHLAMLADGPMPRVQTSTHTPITKGRKP